MQAVEHCSETMELGVCGVGEPRLDGHGVFRVEQKAGRRVVDKQDRCNGTAEAGQVFDVEALKEDTGVAIKAMLDASVEIEKVDHRIGIRRKARREDDDLKVSKDPFEKDINSGSLANVDVMRRFVGKQQWDDEVGCRVVRRRERAVNECLVQVKYHADTLVLCMRKKRPLRHQR